MSKLLISCLVLAVGCIAGVYSRCNPPYYYSYSYYSELQRSYNTGQQVKYGCRGDRYLVGNQYRTCREDGYWSGHIPRCFSACRSPTHYDRRFAAPRVPFLIRGARAYPCNERQGRCPHRYSPQYGSRDNDDSFWYASERASYSCDDGYYLVGERISTCLPNGRWNYDVPICTRQRCSHRLPPKNGFYQPPYNGRTVWYYGQSATYGCSDGYYLDGQATSQCLQSGNWQYPLPQCRRRVQCPHRKPPQQGYYKPSNKNKWFYRDTVEYGCNSGYVLSERSSERSTHTCNINGRWRYKVPTCERRTCNRNNCGVRYNSGCNCDKLCLFSKGGCCDGSLRCLIVG